jgi:Universal stress protein UspA and related nucleotide-binding proteins
MKKILIAFDGYRFSEAAFEFARHLNSKNPILLTGLFIPQVSYANMWAYSSAAVAGAYIPVLDENDYEEIKKNIEKFEQLCLNNNISHRVHKDYYDFAQQELRQETRFADLLILSSEKFFQNLIGTDGEFYMKQALHDAECPVIVIPEKFRFPERNVIAYDGSASSVHAIKQFAYVLPELSKNETLLVYAGDSKDLPNQDLIEELASQHFRNLEIMKLNINPKKYFSSWLQEESSAMLISGAMGRSTFSQAFKKSFVTEVLAEHKLPVFIAHE